MSLLDVSLLGEPRFTYGGEPWRFSAPPRCLPLLALLVLRSEPISRAALAGALWPDSSESEGRANLRRHLHALAKTLPPLGKSEWILSTPQGISWNGSAPASVDVIEFQRAVETDPARAVALYRGELLSTIFDESIVGERERLAELHQNALYELAYAAVAMRDFAAAAEHAGALLALDEWREDAVRVLMTARYSLGDRSGALSIFDRFARRLKTELHAEPMFETAALRNAILANTLTTGSEHAPEPAAAHRPIAGRKEELAALQAAWLRAARGRGACMFISGEAGIGKSRLAHEVATLVEGQGGRAVFGRTSEPEAVAFQPVIEMLRAIVPFLTRAPQRESWLSALLPLVPEIARLYDDLPELAAVDAPLGRLRLNEAVCRAVDACARTRPLAVILEDVHLAQLGTLDILGALAERLSAMPVLLIVTYRSSAAPPESPVRALRRRLQRAFGAGHIALEPLSDCDVARIVEREPCAPDPETRDRIIRLSEGNPLFALQLAQHFAARPAGAPDLETAAFALGDIIVERLEHLSPPARSVAEIAAVIGDSFTAEEIAEVSRSNESSVSGSLTELADYQIVAPRAGAFDYTFTHALIKAAIYGTIGADAARALHRHAARTLTRTRAESGAPHRLVALHWERAGEVAAARAAYLQAAEQALARFAKREAIELAGKVLDAEPALEERFRAHLIAFNALDKNLEGDAASEALEAMEGICEAAGIDACCETHYARYEFHNYRSEREAQTRALDALERLARERAPGKRPRAALARATLQMQLGKTADAEATLRGIEALLPEMTPPEIFDFHSRLAQVLFRQVQFDAARAELRRLRLYLDRHPSLEGEFEYASAELTGAWVSDDPLELQGAGERYVRLAELRGDILAEARGRANLAYLKHQLHDTNGAREDYRAVLDLYEKAGHQTNVFITRLNYGMVEFEAGHVERAAAIWREVGDRSHERDCGTVTIAVDVNLAEVELIYNRPLAALPLARRAYDAARETGEEWLVANTLATLGAAECASGLYDRGLPKIRRAVESSREQVRGLAGYLTHYIEALARRGPSEELDAAAAELEALLREEPLDQQYPGRSVWVLEQAAIVRGDENAAQALHAWGRELVEARAQAFTDPADRAAYLRMPPNDRFLKDGPEHAAAGPILATLLSP